ncbi:MAG: alpha/beta hydrolase [Candidatus Solibacter sp.]|nr:alpha/beta hydrolase [Candidatus Solibacter sp.]
MTIENAGEATLRKQRICNSAGENDLHLVGSGPGMVCWPSFLITGQMWRAQVDHFASSHKIFLADSPATAKAIP